MIHSCFNYLKSILTYFRVSTIPVRVVILTACMSLSIETWSDQEDDWLAPPGKLYQVGNHRLHIYCMGEGSPSVILDAGLGGFSLE